MKICFGFSSQHEHLLDPDYSENNPVGGSETAMLWMGKELSKLGHDISYVRYPEVAPACDVFISLRVWQEFYKGNYPGKQNYLWCQDDVDQPLVNELRNPKVAQSVYDKLDGVFTISNYQQRRWVQTLNLPVSKAILTRNGIPSHLFKFDHLPDKEPWAYYSSTPFRGLDILCASWENIHKQVPGSQLHVFSSMKVYSVGDDKAQEAMYATLKALPGVVYHGSVGQKELRETTARCRVLAYPCTFAETSCITAMEAMASGCAVVSTNIGAMPETAWGNPLVTPQGDWIPTWENMVADVLSSNLQISYRNLFTASLYDWSDVARQWDRIFLSDNCLLFA